MSDPATLAATILPPLLKGAIVTVEVAASAFLIAVVIGLLLALVKTFGSSLLLRVCVDLYVEIFRNVPALTHLFILYFGLASIGVKLTSLSAAILGLGLIGAATLADVFRAGFQSLHAGQREAALAIGMTPGTVLRVILIPQALRTTLPPLANYAAQLVKDTSIVAAIAAPEIMFFARSLVTSTFETTLIYLSAALLYLALSLPLSFAAGRLEKRLGGGR
jgi:polar amino acid transport system permease protein